MRRNTVLPALAVFLVVFAVAVAGFIASRVTVGGGGAAVGIAERLLREDAHSGVQVYTGKLPPALDQILNLGVTNASDRITFPAHPQSKLVGSSHLQQSDGTNLVWLMYEVDSDIGTVADAVAQQLDKSPWQVTARRGEETARILRFTNSGIVDFEGSALVRLIPASDRYRLTVAREGKETTLDVKVTALSPSVSAVTLADLTVQRVEPGPALEAGLKQGDKIVKVNDTAVKSSQELAAALQDVAQTGKQRSTLTYILALRGNADAAAPPPAFAPPKSALALPQDFPAMQAWQGLTVLEYTWGQQPGAPGQQAGGRGYQATMVSKDAAAAVAGKVRDGLKAAGWTITADTPVGFATQVQVAHPGQRLVGQVEIDQFAGDSAYIQVVVQIQSGPATGTP